MFIAQKTEKELAELKKQMLSMGVRGRKEGIN